MIEEAARLKEEGSKLEEERNKQLQREGDPKERTNLLDMLERESESRELATTERLSSIKDDEEELSRINEKP